MPLSYDDIIQGMTGLARPVAHAYSECCTGSSKDDCGHSLQCEGLTATIAALLARAWLLGQENGMAVSQS